MKVAVLGYGTVGVGVYEMLQAAGLSADDAAKMMAQLTASGGSGGTKKPTTYYTDIAGNYYVMDKNGKYVQVDPKNIDYNNGVEDTSKMNNIMAQNIMGLYSNASGSQQAQKAADQAAAQAAATAAASKAQTKTTEAAQRAQQAQNTKTKQQLEKTAEELRRLLGM